MKNGENFLCEGFTAKLMLFTWGRFLGRKIIGYVDMLCNKGTNTWRERESSHMSIPLIQPKSIFDPYRLAADPSNMT
jgi:hypothetical protein